MDADHDDSTIFIVEDDAMVARALARFLRSAGLPVETFGSAEEFLARRPEARQGQLLLDVSLPGSSGPELQSQLRSRGSTLQLHFMSAVEDPGLRQSVLAAGARSWFTKPIDGAELLLAFAAQASGPRSAG
jgi:FixJ family two-component response regulator